MKDLKEALLSPERQIRNQALKYLYTNPVINAKVRSWAKQYNLTICEPDDILQEAIILMDEKIRKGSFEGKSKVETFLLGICFNMIRDQKKKVNRVDLKGEFYDSEQMPNDLQYDFVAVQEQSEDDIAKEQLLMQAFQGLDPKCQEALRDYYFKNLSMAKIAEKRSYSSTQIAKTAVHRCREKLRKLIMNNPILSKKVKELI